MAQQMGAQRNMGGASRALNYPEPAHVIRPEFVTPRSLKHRDDARSLDNPGAFAK
jgi:hypothetical protein